MSLNEAFGAYLEQRSEQLEAEAEAARQAEAARKTVTQSGADALAEMFGEADLHEPQIPPDNPDHMTSDELIDAIRKDTNQ